MHLILLCLQQAFCGSPESKGTTLTANGLRTEPCVPSLETCLHVLTPPLLAGGSQTGYGPLRACLNPTLHLPSGPSSKALWVLPSTVCP